MPASLTPVDPDSPSVRLIVMARDVHTWADRVLERVEELAEALRAYEMEEEAARDGTDIGDA